MKKRKKYQAVIACLAHTARRTEESETEEGRDSARDRPQAAVIAALNSTLPATAASITATKDQKCSLAGIATHQVAIAAS